MNKNNFVELGIVVLLFISYSSDLILNYFFLRKMNSKINKPMPIRIKAYLLFWFNLLKTNQVGNWVKLVVVIHLLIYIMMIFITTTLLLVFFILIFK